MEKNVFDYFLVFKTPDQYVFFFLYNSLRAVFFKIKIDVIYILKVLINTPSSASSIFKA